MAISLTGALAAVIAVGAVAGTLVLRDARLQLREARATHAAFVAETKAAGSQAEAYRLKLEGERNAAISLAEKASAARRRTLVDFDSRLDASRKRLLDGLGAGAGGSAAGEESAAAGCQRTEAERLLLGEVATAIAENGRELEALNEEKRTLLESWTR